jgi:hypothetical protein
MKDDPTPQVKETIRKEEEKLTALTKPIFDATAEYSKLVFDEFKRIQELNIRLPQFEVPTIKIELPDLSSFAATQNYLSVVSGITTMNEQVARLLSGFSTSYYTVDSLKAIPKVELKEQSKNTLISRLEECPQGKPSWKQYQDLCKEILEFLFVPPLNSPFEQSRTETDLQVRDFILDIPYSAGGFWADVRTTFFASAVIVDSKNYSEPLPANGVVINSKYFGKSRCGLFGVILSRMGLSESAKKEQARLSSSHWPSTSS